MLQVYRIVHNIDKIDFDKFFVWNSNQTRGHAWKLDKPRSRTTVRLNSFSQRVINPWNKLPSDVVSAQTLNEFKGALERAWENDPLKSETWITEIGNEQDFALITASLSFLMKASKPCEF